MGVAPVVSSGEREKGKGEKVSGTVFIFLSVVERMLHEARDIGQIKGVRTHCWIERINKS